MYVRFEAKIAKIRRNGKDTLNYLSLYFSFILDLALPESPKTSILLTIIHAKFFHHMKRRDFLHQMTYTAAGLAVLPMSSMDLDSSKKMFFEISLAEWSLHNALFKKEMTNLDFPVMARKEFGIGIVEYVNQFFKDKAHDEKYLKELTTRAKDHGVTNKLSAKGFGKTAPIADNKTEAGRLENRRVTLKISAN